MSSIAKKLSQLKRCKDSICVVLSLPTHRSFPENKQDDILLKNLTVEAEKNLIHKHGKRDTIKIVEILQNIPDTIKSDYNLDSLHVFVSDSVFEVIRLPLKMTTSEVIISNHFDTNYVQKFLDESKEYLILVLGQGGVHIYNALNDHIINEVRNEDFPFAENRHYITHADKASDGKKLDHGVKEYFNHVDKAVQSLSRSSGLKTVVVSTPRNYQHMMAVADNKESYLAHTKINYNDISLHSISSTAWETIKSN